MITKKMESNRAYKTLQAIGYPLRGKHIDYGSTEPTIMNSFMRQQGGTSVKDYYDYVEEHFGKYIIEYIYVHKKELRLNYFEIRITYKRDRDYSTANSLIPVPKYCFGEMHDISYHTSILDMIRLYKGEGFNGFALARDIDNRVKFLINKTEDEVINVYGNFHKKINL